MKIFLNTLLMWATSRIPDGFQEETNWTLYCRGIRIIGGNPSRAYDAFNGNHVFAAMSVRLCIDVNLANPVSLPLMQTVYMRMVDSVDPSTSVVFTIIRWVSGFVI
jgi:hypothetical protein